MKNLLEETKIAIKSSGNHVRDIVFIGSTVTGHACGWPEFKKLADIEYEDGYGAQLVAYDLVIAFNDGSWLERQEYDGAEDWRYVPIFRKPSARKPVVRVASQRGALSLREMNIEGIEKCKN